MAFLAISVSDGSNLVEQCEKRVKQVIAHLGRCIETVSEARGGQPGAPLGPQRVQKGPKQAFWDISWSGGSNLAEQCGTRVGIVKASPGKHVGTIFWVEKGHWESPKG